ncbi:MAG: anaerobic ribonucleoside-triphosphate reductase activating protein [Clostridia bacterium]|nr:anaerobic ribonucleoside-triphosphate reductase activating protein [Clostridia bacterium]
MNYATIKNCDIANGTGVRVSLFVSGCPHRCPGCFNSEAWDFGYGSPFTEETENHLLNLLSPDYVNGLSLLGGEPFAPANQQCLLPFLRRVRETYPRKTIWCYSGYTWEALTDPAHGVHTSATDEMLALLDILVDGPFVEELYDISLLFRGSSNQRILDVPASLEKGMPVLWEGCE